MFNIYKLKELWKNWGFEIVIGSCLLFLIIYALFFRGKGTWSPLSSFRQYFVKPKPVFRQQGGDSKGETECRRVMEKIFRKPFPKVRPDFLRNPVTGNNFNCELDCYNEELKLAVEYNGQQHYKFVPYFHKNKEAFYNMRYRDELKKRMCHDNDVVLIEVPYTVKVDEIENFLFRQLQNKKYI